MRLQNLASNLDFKNDLIQLYYCRDESVLSETSEVTATIIQKHMIEQILDLKPPFSSQVLVLLCCKRGTFRSSFVPTCTIFLDTE